ncbi:hypothetical protein ACOSQ3_028875 [Xanthoceras sorbifolium]
MNRRLEQASKWNSVIPPKIMKNIAHRQDEARFYIVKLDKRICDCGLWEVSRIPCKHRFAVITAKRLHVEDYIDDYLTRDAYIKTYSNVIHLVSSDDQWPKSMHGKVLPLKKRKLPGRPKENRKRVVQFWSSKMVIIFAFLQVNNSATRTSRKRKNFEVSSSSNAAPKRRKVLTTMEGNEAANSTQNVNEDASQPITQNAPLHSSQLQTQQSQSKSNADFISTYKNANEKINKF